MEDKRNLENLQFSPKASEPEYARISTIAYSFASFKNRDLW